MATSAMVNAPRNLPMTTTGEVERLGYALLRGLDRLGFVHEDRNGDIFTIRFDRAVMYGEAWAAFNVDAERLWHFSIADLSKPAILAQLSAVAKKPVRAVTDSGLTYAIELQPKSKVRLPDHVTLDLAQRPAGELMVPLGIGRDGPAWLPLAKIGHALIVGTTGAGKSTWVHVALAALLTEAGSDRLRLALIDPKRHELTAWARSPHLLSEIAHTDDQATKLLDSLEQEIDRRGDLLAGALVRDVAAYNRPPGLCLQSQGNRETDPLPVILCVCDEVLDLTDRRDSIESLKTIARRGRSAGVFLWAATQHAAAIAGLPRVVNVNLSTRLVFRVTDQSAAMAAGCPGAELIPQGRSGRMLAKVEGRPQELQGYDLDDASLAAVAGHVAEQPPVGPILTNIERDLLAWARETDGGLTVEGVKARARVGHREARRLVESLEKHGWLAKDKSAHNQRTLTEQGRAVAEKAAKLPNLPNLPNCQTSLAEDMG